MSEAREPTDRDHFWLDHEAKLSVLGLIAKANAAEHDLSLHARYQFRKRLRALGLRDRTRAVRTWQAQHNETSLRVGSWREERR